MGMNPDTNRFEMLSEDETIKRNTEFEKILGILVRPNGKPVPKHWSIFKVGEDVTVKDYTFKVVYLNESTIILEPVGLPVIGASKKE